MGINVSSNLAGKLWVQRNSHKTSDSHWHENLINIWLEDHQCFPVTIQWLYLPSDRRLLQSYPFCPSSALQTTFFFLEPSWFHTLAHEKRKLSLQKHCRAQRIFQGAKDVRDDWRQCYNCEPIKDTNDKNKSHVLAQIHGAVETTLCW